jgi:hypothetical protein
MTDQLFLKNAPVEVKVFHSRDYKEALDYDQIIITGTDLLNDFAMKQLSKKNPVVMVHHEQTRNFYRNQLMSNAKTLICRTPRHLEIETSWTDPKKATWIISPLDPQEMQVNEKKDFALWAARMHHQKGPVEAQEWAKKNGIELMMMWDKPRAEVLKVMSYAKHFVFLPNGFDAEPRSLIEAVLSGCEVHTNELAGLTSIPNWRDPDTLTELITNAKDLFWETALA